MILFSKPRTLCTCEKLTDNLDILIMAKQKTYRWTFHKYRASLCFVHTNLISVCTDEEIACASWTMQSTEFHNKWMVLQTYLADESETWALNFCLSRLIAICTVVIQVSIIVSFVSLYTSCYSILKKHKISLFNTTWYWKGQFETYLNSHQWSQQLRNVDFYLLRSYYY